MDRANGTLVAGKAWQERGCTRRERSGPGHLRTKRTHATYLKHCALHPYNMPLLVLAIATGLISGSGTVLLLSLAIEVLMLLVVPRLASFRRHVDEVIEQTERLEAAKARAALLLQMDEVHRQELERLEQLVDRARENVKRTGTAAEAVLDDCLGLNRLTACYVRLAIAYKTSKDSLQSTNRQALQDKIRLLEAMKNGANDATDRMRRLAERRLAIALKRAERWDRTQEDLEAITHQLATIGELIHLVHEQSITPIDPRGMSDEIDQFIVDLEENEGTLREISELVVQDEVEVEVLELGRVARAATGT